MTECGVLRLAAHSETLRYEELPLPRLTATSRLQKKLQHSKLGYLILGFSLL